MNTLIQAITDYTTALEQKLSALEARVAQLEQQIEEANEAIGRLGERLEEDPDIEILKEKRLQLAEELDRLETLEITDDAPISTEEPVVEEPEPVVEEPASALVVELEPVVEPAPEPIVAPEPAPQPVPEVKVEPVIEVKVEKPAPQPAQRPMPQQTSLFGAGVEDIRQAISLGDRFLFQRELFAGNGELMQKTLDEINSLGSLSEAMDYVLDNFEWDKESTAVQLFENVLKRRFG